MVPPNGVSRGRALGIDMDELVVVGGVGELVDHGLRHDAPRRDADLLADDGQQLIERDRFNASSPWRPPSVLEQRHPVLHRLAAIDRQDGAR